VLVSGPRPPDPGEFVGSRRLGEILARLHETYDMVILDTPPILRVGDALTLSAHVDGMLIVTKLALARRPILAELRRVLATSPTKTLGYVVTGSRDGQASGYGYGYDYGGYGFREPTPEEVAAHSKLTIPADDSGSVLARSTSTPERESQ
jgi:Mrp family chromosome partitioning ATPase